MSSIKSFFSDVFLSELIFLFFFFQLEYIFSIFGAHKFNEVISNLSLFSRRFNELSYWVPTVVCSCESLPLRASLIRKFIKIAIG